MEFPRNNLPAQSIVGKLGQVLTGQCLAYCHISRDHRHHGAGRYLRPAFCERDRYGASERLNEWGSFNRRL